MWIKVDSKFPKHWKVMLAAARLGHRHAGGRVIAVWLEGMAFIHESETAGFLPRDAVLRFVHEKSPLAVADAMAKPLTDAEAEQWGVVVTDDPLTRRILWYAVPGGWRVHDYLEYQGRAVEISHKRRESGRAGGLASGAARKARREANPEANASWFGSANEQPNGEQQEGRKSKHLLKPGTGTASSFGTRYSGAPSARCGKPVDTAALTRGDSQTRKKKFEKPASLWMRISAIAREVIREFPDDSVSWDDEVKQRCKAQGIPFTDSRGYYLRSRSGAAVHIAALESEEFKAIRRGELAWDHRLKRRAG